MTYSDRDPRRRWRRNPDLRLASGLHPRARRRGVWGVMAALAVILVLGIVFYGLNNQRPETLQTTADQPNATTGAAPASDVPPAKRQTTGQGTGSDGSAAQNSANQGGGQGAAGQGGQTGARPPQGSAPQPANDVPERQSRP